MSTGNRDGTTGSRGRGAGTDQFKIGKYWLGREAGRARWYRYWYHAGARKIRRRALEATEFEDAKLELAAFVLGEAPDEADAPENVLIVTVQKFYMDHHARPRAERLGWTEGRLHTNYEYPFDILFRYLDDDAAKVSQLDGARLEDFMHHCVTEFGHSVATVSRNLQIVNAAMRYAAKTRVITDANGERRQVKLLKYAPEVISSKDDIARITSAPATPRKVFVPTVRELAAFIDAIEAEHLFRYCVIALNTWARPQAITDLNTAEQVDYDNGLIYLNPPEREQTDKHRPAIKLTEGLRSWFEVWPDYPIEFRETPVGSVKGAFKRHRKRVGLDGLTRYGLRHFMSRQVAAAGVPRDQRKHWLGHHRSDTTAWYEEFEPAYLDECATATEKVIGTVDRHMKIRSMFAPKPGRNVVLLHGAKDR